MASASMPGRGGRRGAKQTASAGGSRRGNAPGGGFHAGDKEWCTFSECMTCSTRPCAPMERSKI